MTENNNTQQFIEQLANSKGVSEEKIKEIIIDSFCTSYCKGENTGAELHFKFNSGLSVYRRYKIVETIKEPEKEITKDNKLIKEGKIEDDNFLLPIDIKNLPPSLDQEFKNHLLKGVEKISWVRQYKLYKPQQGEIIKGIIKSTQEENYYSVDLGQGTGHWKKSEWKLRDEPRLGQHFWLLIKEVREMPTEDTPQIILTRFDDLFMRKLLEKEIPQIKRGIIVVHDILRLPGLISKIMVEKGKAVFEKRIDIDPAGTCIGKGGEMARSISGLIYPERIDFADWSEDKKKLLPKLLSPVKLVKLIIKNEKEWEIIVHHQKAALLLQHEGKILKKISDYLGVKIHVKILEEMEKEDKVLENKGQILEEIGNYKNVDVRIVEEIEK